MSPSKAQASAWALMCYNSQWYRSFKLHTQLLFFRKHICCKCVWDRILFSMSTLLNAKPILLWSFCLVLTSCGLFPLPRLPCALFHLPFVLFQGCPSTSVMCEYPWNSMVVGMAQRWFRLSEFNLSFFLRRCFSSKQMMMQVSLCGENLLLILLVRNKALF